MDLVHRHVRDRGVLARRDEPELPARARRIDVHAGMERDRHAEALARRPEVVVHVMIERELVDVGRRTHEHAAQPGGDGVLDLRARRGDVLQRHGRHAEQARRLVGTEVGQPVVVRTLAVGDERGVVQRRDLVGRSEEHREARVEHDRVDAVGVEIGDPGLGLVTARPAQPFHQVVELARRHPDRGRHLVVELAATAAYDPADIGGLVDLVFDRLVRDPLTPAVVVDALRRPDVVGLFHDVAVAVDDLHACHGAIFPRSPADGKRDDRGVLSRPDDGRARRAAPDRVPEGCSRRCERAMIAAFDSRTRATSSSTCSRTTYFAPSTSVITVSGVDSMRSMRSGFSANAGPLRRVTVIIDPSLDLADGPPGP